MTKPKANKLSVYMVRSELTDHMQILRDAATLSSKVIDGVGTFYFGESHEYQPDWVQDFFAIALQGLKIFGATSKGLLLVDVQVSPNLKRTFALAFGYGWMLLEPGAVEERFGLRVVLNSVDPKSIRRVDKKALTSTPKDTHEQLSRAGAIADFGLDIEQDLVRAITGVSKDSRFGKTITGKDALNVTVKVDATNVGEFLKLSYEKSVSKSYQATFPWIDQIAEVKKPSLIEALNSGLVGRIKAGQHDITWMAVPELLDWADVAGFKYRRDKKAVPVDDIQLDDFLASLAAEERANLSMETLTTKLVYCYSSKSQDIKHQWRAYDCLYSELHDDETGSTFMLSNGRWYEVEKTFADRVNAGYQQLRDTPSDVELPTCSFKDEGDYNKDVPSKDHSFCCLDANLISHGGGYSSIEFCDLLSTGKRIVHVKRYGSSKVLSHLFAQGVVSGELFASDAEFRSKLNDKLPNTHKLQNVNSRPKVEDYEVVFAVISKSDEPLEIPFFSKVSLKNARQRLDGIGFRVRLKRIPAAQPPTA